MGVAPWGVVRNRDSLINPKVRLGSWKNMGLRPELLGLREKDPRV
jgi:hypothetical protein